MYSIDINKYLKKLKSYRKNLFNKYISKNNTKHKQELKKIDNEINKITYTEEFFNDFKSILKNKEL